MLLYVITFSGVKPLMMILCDSLFGSKLVCMEILRLLRCFQYAFSYSSVQESYQLRC